MAMPASMAHPAKASWDLAYRIIDHLRELGLLPEGSTILDPMAGTGTTLLAASVKGYTATGIELEPKFIALAQKNVDRLMARTWAGNEISIIAPITIIQGDAA